MDRPRMSPARTDAMKGAPGRPGLLGALAVTGIDQALLSVLNFAVALLFIRYAAKEEYGHYTLVNGAVMLAVGVQTALVITPLTANGTRLEGEARRAFVAALFLLQAAMAVVAALVLGAGVWLAVRGGGGGPDALLLGAGAGAAVLGSFMREFHRSVEFLGHRSARALAGDIVYVAIAATVLAALWLWTRSLHAWMVLTSVGAGAFLPGLTGFLRGGGGRATMADCRAAARLLVGQGKWTLPGMAVTWGQTTGYSYIVAAFLGSAAVAEVSAARLFVMPLNTLMTAWGKIFVPRAGTLLASGDRAGVITRTRQNAVWLLAASMMYVGAVTVFFALGGGRLLPPKYGGLGALVLCWCVLGVVNIERCVATQALLAHGAFRTLFRCALWGAASSLLLVVALVDAWGKTGAVLGLVGGEVVLGAVAWLALSTDHAPPDAIQTAAVRAGLSAG
jgi:O-antigen/teichoic acid export membrane protein